jgi:hypothetical protein
MSLPSTRRQLKDWVLRRLGAPVIDINISSDQCEDRLCEALSYFMQYHNEGVEEIYLKHKVTASTLNFSAAVIPQFQDGEVIVGLTSGATTQFIDKAQNNLSIRVQKTSTSPTFIAGETVRGQNSLTVGILTPTNFYIPGDIDNQFLPLGNDIISISNILSIDNGFGGNGIWNTKYQFALNNLPNLVSTDIVSYDMFKKHMALLDFELNAQPNFRFNQITERVYIDGEWGTQIKVDQYIIIKSYKALNPAQYPKVYENYFLRQYAYLLFKMQWGNNLKKYDGVALIGGVTLNGQKIYDEALDEMAKLEERLQKEFQLPMGYIFMG